MSYMQGPKYRVAVRQDYIFGMALSFAMDFGGETIRIMRFDQDGMVKWQEENRMVTHEPSLRIEEGFARALYDELGSFFNGNPDITNSRADYLHERERVDNLIKVVCLIAMDEIEENGGVK